MKLQALHVLHEGCSENVNKLLQGIDVSGRASKQLHLIAAGSATGASLGSFLKFNALMNSVATSCWRLCSAYMTASPIRSDAVATVWRGDCRTANCGNRHLRTTSRQSYLCNSQSIGSPLALLVLLVATYELIHWVRVVTIHM